MAKNPVNYMFHELKFLNNFQTFFFKLSDDVVERMLASANIEALITLGTQRLISFKPPSFTLSLVFWFCKK